MQRARQRVIHVAAHPMATADAVRECFGALAAVEAVNDFAHKRDELRIANHGAE